MTAIPVSVVVVSRGRPALLARTLTGLSQVQYAAFEIIVVADREGIASAEALPFADALKRVPFDDANISAARNVGISHAAGDVVAFIDDDAVPEPQWLHHLIAPFARAEVAAAGGFVRGRNGISFQWQARGLDQFGATTPLEVDPEQATVLTPPKGRAIKTEGTNMAVRRTVLRELGGFDAAFHYYLDETDLNLRLAQSGGLTAIVPLAEVHHGFAANPVRRADRVPQDLYEIGASWAVFQRKHVPEAERARHWQALRAHERRRLVGHMVGGGVEPRDVRRILRRLDAGYAEGQGRSLTRAQLPAHPAEAFKPFPSKPRRSVVISTRPWRFARDMARAAEKVKNGEIVTVLSFSLTSIYHQCRFDPCGAWVQRGGLFGRSVRSEPLFRLTTRARRTEKESNRVAKQRGLTPTSALKEPHSAA